MHECMDPDEPHSFVKIDLVLCYIINKFSILTKPGTDRIHAVIPTKYQKDPSTTILKYANLLAKENKSP